MKLLMVSTLNLSKQNGGKVHFTSLAKGFRAQGHQVDAILPTTGDAESDRQIAQQHFHSVTFTSNALTRLIPFSKTSVNSLAQNHCSRTSQPQRLRLGVLSRHAAFNCCAKSPTASRL